MDNIWTGTTNIVLQMYTGFLSPQNLLYQVILLIVVWVVFEVLAWIFPAFQRLINLIFLPFRWLHVYAHLYTGHLLREREAALPSGERTSLFPVLSTALDRDDSASANIRPSNLRAAYSIAMAPNIMVILFLVINLLSGQILSANKQLIEDLLLGDLFGLYLVYFLHFYCFLGLTRLGSSFEDYHFIILTYMSRCQASPFYLGWSLVVFTVTFTAEMFTTRKALPALIFGILAAVIYLLLYMLVISCFQEPKMVVDWGTHEAAEQQEILDTAHEEIINEY